MTKPALKLAPYGESDFSILRANNLAYVDKTEFIAKLESLPNRYPFIVRPRRFGKTLFTKTLQAYYDIAAAKDFERNFSDTYIGKHKTALASSFHVIHLDFSNIDINLFTEGFVKKVQEGLHDFCVRYGFKKGLRIVKKNYPSPSFLLSDFIQEYKENYKEQIYLIVDEYDQGPNEVLATSLEDFQELTGDGGLLKTFYSKIKELSAGGPIARVFITGVTSIQLDSMTSGFSVAKNLTSDERFASMFGFTESELQQLIPQLVDLKKYGKTLDEVFFRMKEWYNGYCFNPDTSETVFNSSMCLNYLSSIADVGKEPADMLDSSVANSLRKIESILSLGDNSLVKSIVDKSLKNEAIDFGGTLQVLDLNQNNGLDQEALLSALFYMGFLTYVSGNRRKLIVPNRAIGIQFFGYYFKNILKAPKYNFDDEEFATAYSALAQGNPEPWLRLADARLSEDSGLHLATHINEVAFQTMLSSTLWFSKSYRGRLESESRGKDSGFIDLLLKPQDSEELPTYIIEIKHLKSDAKSSEVQASLEKAKMQANRYATGEDLKEIPNLKRLAVVYLGLRLAAFEVF